MSKKQAILSLSLALLWTSAGSAQQQDMIKACERIVDSGLKEYSIKTNSSEFLNFVYERSCETNGNVKSKGIDIGIDTIVKSIPVNFTGNYSSNEEAMRNFCKSYQSLATGKSNSFERTEKIIERAYQSFDQCMGMVAQGVVVTHTIRSLEKADVFIAPGFRRTVTVKGIDASSGIECEGHDPAKPSDGSVPFSKGSRIEVGGEQTLNVICTRTAKTGSAGEQQFVEGTVTLFTDVGRSGNYGMYWPGDVKLPIDKASEIANQLSALRNTDTRLGAELARVGNVGAPGPVALTRATPAGAAFSDQAGINWVTCPAGYYVAAVGGYDSDGGKYCSTCISHVGVQCLPLKGDAPPATATE